MTAARSRYAHPSESGFRRSGARWARRLAALCLAAAPLFGAVASDAGAAAAKPPAVRLFGTVEFRGPLKSVPVWRDVLTRNGKNPIFTPGSKLNRSTAWEDLKERVRGKPPLEQIKIVNRFWNGWPYRLDPEVYGKQDYWAIPHQFRKNSGDCEDYSIAKYFTLRELGFSADQLRIVVLMETIRNIAHAVLVVYLDGDAYVLDNLGNSVLSHTKYRNYAPQFSVNEKFRWAHVKPK